MKSRILNGSLVAVAVLVLTSCGFHLRGTGSARMSLSVIHVTANDAYGEMQQALQRALTEAGVKLVPADKAAYSVHLLTERRIRRSVATTSDVQVAEYGLNMEVSFELTDSAGKQVIEPATVSAQRIYRFDSSSLVGSNEEENLLNEEMRRDIASQIIRRIDATIRARNGKSQ